MRSFAFVVEDGGRVSGAARGGCSDLYGASTPDAALAEIHGAAAAAMTIAGVTAADLDLAAYGLAGADWPEDFRLLQDRLAAAIPTRRPPLVVNDAIGALWAGTGGGLGAAAACGTYAAIAAAGPAGVWHSSFWVEPAGAVPLAESALRAVCRSELGTAPRTHLVERMLAAGGFDTVESLLHHFTCRDRPPRTDIARFAPTIFDAAEEGDPVARGLIDDQAAAIARSVQAGVSRSALAGSYPLVLAGGLFRRGSSLLSDEIAAALPDSRPQITAVEPAAGVALMAAHSADFPRLDGLLSSIPVATEIPDWRSVIKRRAPVPSTP